MRTPALRDRDLALLHKVFQAFPCVREVRLFGSRATGNARRASDIDLAISAPEATPREWFDLTGAIEELPIVYDLDVVRMETLQNQQLMEKIAREALPIYTLSLSPGVK
jgi:hypothetical protein